MGDKTVFLRPSHKWWFMDCRRWSKILSGQLHSIGILQLICLTHINYYTHFYLAIEVVIPTQDSILTVESITLPNVSLSSFGNITSMFEIPSAVILNQVKMEGTYIVFCANYCNLYSATFFANYYMCDIFTLTLHEIKVLCVNVTVLIVQVHDNSFWNMYKNTIINQNY